MAPLPDNPALRPSIYADLPGDIATSFEFFPPKTEAMERTLWESVETLTPLAPRFVSVTYGAGGSTRERTHATVARIARDTPIPAAAHLTCVNASRAEIDVIADEYWQAGVRHIVALRGDPPAKDARFEARSDGYATSAELVAGLKRRHDFEISVGVYPEVHPEAASAAADLDALKAKLDAGATRGTPRPARCQLRQRPCGRYEMSGASEPGAQCRTRRRVGALAALGGRSGGLDDRAGRSINKGQGEG